ncbi:DUF1918 domain-containing protein [Streptomyces lavendulae]|uniref:DUF1918 domain-containing protein n=1 Tax=Streptomyces lavendulae TaxID=1914 RepID=UPI003F4D524E
MVVEGPGWGSARRDGEVVGPRRHDGRIPARDIRWSDTGPNRIFHPAPMPTSSILARHIEETSAGARGSRCRCAWQRE